MVHGRAKKLPPTEKPEREGSGLGRNAVRLFQSLDLGHERLNVFRLQFVLISRHLALAVGHGGGEFIFSLSRRVLQRSSLHGGFTFGSSTVAGRTLGFVVGV